MVGSLLCSISDSGSDSGFLALALIYNLPLQDRLDDPEQGFWHLRNLCGDACHPMIAISVVPGLGTTRDVWMSDLRPCPNTILASDCLSGCLVIGLVLCMIHWALDMGHTRT